MLSEDGQESENAQDARSSRINPDVAYPAHEAVLGESSAEGTLFSLCLSSELPHSLYSNAYKLKHPHSFPNLALGLTIPKLGSLAVQGTASRKGSPEGVATEATLYLPRASPTAAVRIDADSTLDFSVWAMGTSAEATGHLSGALNTSL